jgi:hypothetical protein
MCVDNLPAIVCTTKKKGLITAVMDAPAVLLNRGLYFDISNRPGKFAFYVRLNVAEHQIQSVQNIALRLYMMLDKVLQALVLAAGFNVASALLPEKVFVERLAVATFPPGLYGRNDLSQLIIVFTWACRQDTRGEQRP